MFEPGQRVELITNEDLRIRATGTVWAKEYKNLQPCSFVLFDIGIFQTIRNERLQLVYDLPAHGFVYNYELSE